MTYADALKRFRKDFNVTQQQVADSAGIFKQVYQRYEYGREPALSVLCKIADAYNISLDYLVGRSDDPHLPRMDDETRSLFLALKALKESHVAAK